EPARGLLRAGLARAGAARRGPARPGPARRRMGTARSRYGEGVGVNADEVTGFAVAARDGDADAAARFVRATQVDVWRLCAALGDPGEADDLTQETYLRAFGALPRFGARSGARTWLLAIARRVCADRIRQRRRRPRVDGRVTGAEPPPAPDGGDGVAVRAVLA